MTASPREFVTSRAYGSILDKGSPWKPISANRYWCPTLAIPEQEAMKMVQAAHGVAEAIDIFITAVVLDESGRLVALGRMDNATPVTVDLAMNKAFTAASFQQPTRDLQALAGQSWFQSLIVSSGGKITPG